MNVAAERFQSSRERWLAAIRRASMEGLGALALIMLALFTIAALHGHSLAADAMNNYRAGARDLFAGRSPYDLGDIPRGSVFASPPIVGVAYAPLLLVSTTDAEIIAAAVTLACIAGTLWVLSVRDWRCYAIVGLWFPTLFAFQSGNLSAALTLLAAIGWCYRDRWLIAAVAVAFAVALKVYCWPLIVFLFITRRFRAGFAATAGAAALVVVPWAAFGFVGLRGYPHLLGEITRIEQPEGFSLAGAFAPLVSWPLARIGAYAIGVLVLAAAWHAKDERSRFLLCLAATLALTPILWMHYFAAIAVVIALTQPRLGWLWFVPLALWAVPRVPQAPHGMPDNLIPAWQTTYVAAIVTAIIAISLRGAELRRPVQRT
jgi:hypothetical protein